MPRLRDVIRWIKSRPGFIGIGSVKREGRIITIEYFTEDSDPKYCNSHVIRLYVKDLDKPDEKVWIVR